MYNTEVKYHDDLQTILEKIQYPLVNGGFINPDEVQITFPNIKNLIDFSVIYRDFLKKVLSNWDIKTSAIGQEFIKLSNFIQLYADYFKCYTKAKEKITNLLQN